MEEHASKAGRLESRLKEINAEIVELKEAIAAASRNPRARALLLEDLDKLLELREGVQIDANAKPPLVIPGLEIEAVVAALIDTIEDLQANLENQSPEAVQARDQLRRCIDEITINPAPGTTLDGRGAGPVSITVEGLVTEFLDLGSIAVNRASQRPSGTKSLLGDTVLAFSFSFRLQSDEVLERQAYQDLPIIARLLDRATVPVTLRSAADAFVNGDNATEEDIKHARWRAREAFNYLRELGIARRIAGGPKWKGWVWEQSGLTDEQWIERARAPSNVELTAPRFAVAPEAKVVVIGPKAAR